MSHILINILAGWAGLALFMTVLWRFAMARDNAGWVDFGWALSLVLLLAWYSLVAGGEPWRRLFYLVLASTWGLRLSWHMFQRLRSDRNEDPRYRLLREHWGESARWKFYFFFQAQGLANVFLSLPVYLLMSNRREDFSFFDLAGALVVAAAVLGESLADRQLRQWKADPSSQGRTCRKGLWAVSRHPNYFFEWVHWLAYPVLGLSLLGTTLAAWWPLTLLGPVLMLLFLIRFTGIPYTEKRALASRGEDYRKYQREVSAFFPWFPKSEPQS